MITNGEHEKWKKAVIAFNNETGMSVRDYIRKKLENAEKRPESEKMKKDPRALVFKVDNVSPTSIANEILSHLSCLSK